MKTLIVCLLLCWGCSRREEARSKQVEPSWFLPAQVVRQIIEDHYAGKLPARVRIPVERWSFHSTDLNEDGQSDYVIEHEDPDFCGSGGCSVLIYVSNPSGFRCVYSGGAFFSECVSLPFKTNGLHDLVFKNTLVTGDAFFSVFWFDGKTYQAESSGQSARP
jgi:hypothetical protein